MSREDVFDLLEKAKDSLRAADLLLNDFSSLKGRVLVGGWQGRSGL